MGNVWGYGCIYKCARTSTDTGGAAPFLHLHSNKRGGTVDFGTVLKTAQVWFRHPSLLLDNYILSDLSTRTGAGWMDSSWCSRAEEMGSLIE
jgi:hypothetical protein